MGNLRTEEPTGAKCWQNHQMLGGRKGPLRSVWQEGPVSDAGPVFRVRGRGCDCGGPNGWWGGVSLLGQDAGPRRSPASWAPASLCLNPDEPNWVAPFPTSPWRPAQEKADASSLLRDRPPSAPDPAVSPESGAGDTGLASPPRQRHSGKQTPGFRWLL